MVSRGMGLIRPHGRKLSALHRVVDSASILLALVAAAYIYDGQMSSTRWIAALLAVIYFQLAGEVLHVYASWRTYTLRQELSELAMAGIIVGALLAMTGYLTKTSDHFSRTVMVTWAALNMTVLALQRIVIRTALQELRARGHNSRLVAIAGAGDTARRVAARLMAANTLGLRPVGFFDDNVPVGTIPGPDSDLAVAGDLDDLVWQAKDGAVDYIYIALPLVREKEIMMLIQKLSDTTASVFFVPDFFAFEMLQARLADINGMPVVSVFETPFLGLDGWLKRAEDLLIATIGVVITSPIMLAIAIGVKLSSPGPVLFRQRRYGLSGKVVEVWKFRTMTVTEDGEEVPQAQRDDPRVTPFGAFLRRMSLDELPQFFNVLQGSMSVVGPRPHAVAHNEQYRGLVPGYMLRHKVKPGITGWAQVNGWRGETETIEKMKKRVEYDLYYIRNWSLLLDFKIVAMTVVIVPWQPGTY
ncbi:MAG: undecaprenyl-phosphate glucose phosphotransferase [Burkholderiales bacterium]|nr:undecaprenyl-phosphate glucose phosphotransferase [Burkholderiales bacterium]